MTDTPTEAGLFARVDDSRTVRGLLLPFGEMSRPNLSATEPIEFSAASVSVPRDPSVVTLNDEHDRFNPIGRATALQVTDAGIVADFAIANTDEGDAFLASPSKRKLSAELAGIVRDGAKALRSRLTGAAVCTEGAFASAGLFSLAPGEVVGEEIAGEITLDSLTPEVRAELERQVREEIAAEITTTDATQAEETEDSKEETMTASATAEQKPAGPQVPATLLASAPAPAPADVDMNAVFTAMAGLKNGGSDDAEKALFALADITTTGAGALPAAGVIPPAWVGKLWQGKRYQRKYIDLATHTYGAIDLGGRKGFRINQDTALVAKRTGGEKKELPTGSASTGTRESTRESYGYAADVAQEWNYLTGGAEVLAAFWQGVADSYAKVTDLDALATLFQVASRGDSGAALNRRIAPESLPAGTPANSAYYPGVVQLIQAIEAISDADDDPAWAVVNPALWKQLIYTPKDLLPEFVSLSVTAGTGEASVEGKVQVRKAPQSAFVGTNPANPQVIAGSKAAVEFKELGETPIQIDAVNVAKFGLDRSIVGFLETFIVRPESTVFIGTAAA